ARVAPVRTADQHPRGGRRRCSREQRGERRDGDGKKKETLKNEHVPSPRGDPGGQSARVDRSDRYAKGVYVLNTFVTQRPELEPGNPAGHVPYRCTQSRGIASIDTRWSLRTFPSLPSRAPQRRSSRSF